MDEKVFGNLEFEETEHSKIQDALRNKLGKELVSERGSGGANVTFLEGWRAIEIANHVFGFNGWSTTVIDLSRDYLDEGPAGKWSAGYTSVIRVSLKDGSFHEDVGFGESTKQPGKGTALEMAKKASITDGTKRALRLFGNLLGNSLYDKEHLKNMKATKVGASSRGAVYGEGGADVITGYGPDSTFVTKGASVARASTSSHSATGGSGANTSMVPAATTPRPPSTASATLASTGTSPLPPSASKPAIPAQVPAAPQSQQINEAGRNKSPLNVIDNNTAKGCYNTPIAPKAVNPYASLVKPLPPINTSTAAGSTPGHGGANGSAKVSQPPSNPYSKPASDGKENASTVANIKCGGPAASPIVVSGVTNAAEKAEVKVAPPVIMSTIKESNGNGNGMSLSSSDCNAGLSLSQQFEWPDDYDVRAVEAFNEKSKPPSAKKARIN